MASMTIFVLESSWKNKKDRPQCRMLNSLDSECVRYTMILLHGKREDSAQMWVSSQTGSQLLFPVFSRGQTAPTGKIKIPLSIWQVFLTTGLFAGKCTNTIMFRIEFLMIILFFSVQHRVKPQMKAFSKFKHSFKERGVCVKRVLRI